MITNNNIQDLKNIVGNLSYKDYMRAYKKSDRYLKGKYTLTGRERKFKGYALSNDTVEAYNVLTLATKESLSIEEETTVKEYLLKIKMRNYDLIVARAMEGRC